MIRNPIAIKSGINLPVIDNPGSASDLLSGKQLIGQDENLLTGTMPEVEQATPSITVDENGLITASSTQSAGKVLAGTKSATRQLTTQGLATVAPGTSPNIAVPKGRYTTNNVYVAGDARLIPENIKGGVSIFGVLGTASVASEVSFVGDGNQFVVIGGVTSMPKTIAITFDPSTAFPSAANDLYMAYIVLSGFGPLPGNSSLIAYSTVVRMEKLASGELRPGIGAYTQNAAGIYSGGLQIFFQNAKFVSGLTYRVILI